MIWTGSLIVVAIVLVFLAGFLVGAEHTHRALNRSRPMPRRKARR